MLLCTLIAVGLRKAEQNLQISHVDPLAASGQVQVNSLLVLLQVPPL